VYLTVLTSLSVNFAKLVIKINTGSQRNEYHPFWMLVYTVKIKVSFLQIFFNKSNHNNEKRCKFVQTIFIH